MSVCNSQLARNLPSGLHATPYTIQLCPRNTLDAVPVVTSQMVTNVSVLELARCLPSGLQSIS